MTVVWQLDNKNSSKRLIKKRTKMIIFEHLKNSLKWKIFHIFAGSVCIYAWWRHDKETFSALLALCKGIDWSPVNSPHEGSAMRNFGVFFVVVSLNKPLNKHSSWPSCDITAIESWNTVERAFITVSWIVNFGVTLTFCGLDNIIQNGRRISPCLMYGIDVIWVTAHER